MSSATSPNQEGVAGTDSEDIWMLTEESAILFISPSLLGTILFFLIKEAYFYAGPLLVTSRCAIRGTSEQIAQAAGLHERYVREWLAALVTGHIVTYDTAHGTYALPLEHAASL